MSYYTQQNAKDLVEKQMYRRHGFGFGAIPSINLIGIGYGRIIVQVEDETHPANYYIPTELDELTGFHGLPVDIEYGGLYRLQRGGGGGGGGGCQGGARVSSSEQGTCMLVGRGVQDSNNKYAVVSHHVTRGCQQSATIGGQRLNVHKSSGCGRVFWEGCAMGPANNCSENVLGLGVPKGIMKPTIGMACIMQAQTTGKLSGKVVGINFNAPRSVSLGQGACSISIQDMFKSHPCPTHGDSGGAFWNDQGYILGIVTYGSTSQGGKSDPKCDAYNPSAIHMPEVIGVTCGAGVVGGGTAPPLTPGGIANPTSQQQQAQRRRQQGYDIPVHTSTNLELDWNVPDVNEWLRRFQTPHPEFLTEGYAANQCIMKGIIWYQNKILDTGTPGGGPAYRGAPAPFYNMNQLYQGHNLVIGNNGTFLYPASNNKATGQGQKLNDCRNGPLTKPAKGCSPSLSGGGGGNCSGGDRYINAQMQTKQGKWISWRCMIDSGASFMMCNRSQMQQLGLQAASDNCDLKYTAMVPMIIPPAKKQIQMPVGTRDYGQRNFTPTSPVIMSEAVTVVITKDYTILVANDGSGALTYSCRGSGSQSGDVLNGAWEFKGTQRQGYYDSYAYSVTLA